MKPSWKELSRILSYIILFGVMAYNLYVGTSVPASLFRGIVAFLIFEILNIAITNAMVRILNDFELKRLKELNAKEEQEEFEALEDEELYETEASSDSLGGTK